MHYPVYNRKRKIIASAITNLDIHDLGRLTATFGLAGLYLVTPLTDQQELARRIVGYWVTGSGSELNPDRATALQKVRVSEDLGRTVDDIEKREGVRPLIFITGARENDGALTYGEAKKIIGEARASLLLFGTGWGMADELFDQADHILEPIRGMSGFNHLSVRTAAAIILDRLLA